LPLSEVYDEELEMATWKEGFEEEVLIADNG
jgi:hypothetical protein